MDIWLINHHAVPPKYYPLARQTCFARYLMAMGHTVTIFAASTVHNSNMNLITDGAPWRDEVVDGVHYVYIRCMDYQGNGLKRIYNICEFAWKLPVCAGSSPDPMPLWPPLCPPRPVPWGFIWPGNTAAGAWRRSQISGRESIVAYGIAGPRNPRCWPFGGWRSGSMKRRMTWCSPARADMTISSSRAGGGRLPRAEDPLYQ